MTSENYFINTIINAINIVIKLAGVDPGLLPRSQQRLSFTACFYSASSVGVCGLFSEASGAAGASKQPSHVVCIV